MPKVLFKFDKEKDLYNLWETCNEGLAYGFDFSKNIDSKTLAICKNKKFDECKDELAKRFAKMYSSKLIPISLESVNKAWNEINDEYFRRLEKIMKKPIYRKFFIGYLTFSSKCPYILKENAFYFSFFRSILEILKTAGHEIMHLQFHNTYWNQIEKQIGKEKTHDLKESLTILLNLEFRDLWFVEDKGYESHRHLREFISNEWKRNKDFEILLKKCIDYIKKEDNYYSLSLP